MLSKVTQQRLSHGRVLYGLEAEANPSLLAIGQAAASSALCGAGTKADGILHLFSSQGMHQQHGQTHLILSKAKPRT